MRNDLVGEVKEQFSRLRASGNHHGRECLTVIAAGEMARRGGGNAHQRAKARRWAAELVRQLAAA